MEQADNEEAEAIPQGHVGGAGRPLRAALSAFGFLAGRGSSSREFSGPPFPAVACDLFSVTSVVAWPLTPSASRHSMTCQTQPYGSSLDL